MSDYLKWCRASQAFEVAGLLCWMLVCAEFATAGFALMAACYWISGHLTWVALVKRCEVDDPKEDVK